MEAQGLKSMAISGPLKGPRQGAPGPTQSSAGPEADSTERQGLIKAAREFEAVFLNQLMKSMRKTVPESKLFNSGGPMKFYQQMQDAEMAKAMANQKGGFGIADLIVQQFVPQTADPKAASAPAAEPSQAALPTNGHKIDDYRRNSCLNGNQASRVRLKAMAARQGPAVADTLRRFEPELQAASAESGLSPELILSVVMEESGGDPQASSAKGARGLMQLMPGTAREMGVEEPGHPGQNLQGGSKYLANMLRKYDGDLPLALAAYNAGPGNVDKAGPAIPAFPETRKYVERVLTRMKDLGGGTELALPTASVEKQKINSE